MVELDERFEVVTKLEVAERQLRVAIRLFFERRDTIAVHTLAAAAHSVLVDLARPRGLRSLFQRDKPGRPEDKEERRVLRVAQNFLKYMGKDPNAKMPFSFEPTMFLLYDAALLHWRLKGGQCNTQMAVSISFEPPTE